MKPIKGKLDVVALVKDKSRRLFASMPRPKRIPNKKRLSRYKEDWRDEH